MPKLDLSRQEIVDILSERKIKNIEFYIRIVALQFNFQIPILELDPELILEAVRKGERGLLELVAMRLRSGGTGRIITQDETRQMYDWVMSELIKQLPLHNRAIMQQIADPIVGFSLYISHVWYADTTFEAEVEYVEAVCTLAAAHMLTPLVFLRQIPSSHDDVTRWLFSPDSFRKREMARYDSVDPSKFADRLIHAIRQCEDAIHMAYSARADEVRIREMTPKAISHQVMRAKREARVEEDLKRIWPEAITDSAYET